ncbi:hypothetical protein H7I42_14000 [Mycolicibacterium vanbaalenii PYR-1]|uniref:DUF6745 domain-containing protein n=2 Tax=Mycolicibacterium vanbaalenii TaxID=110539 RepID=A1THS1_MYCVP|nr:hypothetical protein Mvan_5963 [Mycolicibacterium vanbaalenii PYR-1]MCV7128351.1 hypothetical protein [Mycolicibacterium vanbaalenii PYR-1]
MREVGGRDVFDEHRVAMLVEEFCRYRGVDAGTRIRVVENLDAAYAVVARKGPDHRWKTIATRHSGADFPPAHAIVPAVAERQAYDHALRMYHRAQPASIGRSWWLRHVVVSAAHWQRFSKAINTARQHGLGWMIRAHKDVVLVPRPALRYLEGSPGLLDDDSGRMAVEWPDGTGFHFLRGTPIDAELYKQIVDGQLSLRAVTAIADADVRSIALSYMSFQQLTSRTGAQLLDVGVRGTALYRLPLPGRIARDRSPGYGDYDYFIHMHDASHPDREFVEWVDPRIGARRDAELCQAHAFGITLQEWLSIEQEG